MEEIGDLSAAVVVDQGIPVAVQALARIGMLIDMRPVEAGKAVGIVGEMTRHPIGDDFDAGGMEALHQSAKLVRGAVARGRREQRSRLIAPRALEGKLRDGHQLDMGESHVLHIGDEAFGKLKVAEAAIGVLRYPRPGSQMAFVDRDGRAPRIGLGPGVDPGLVRPLVALRRGDDRARAGRPLRLAGQRIGLQRQELAGRGLDLVFVDRTDADARERRSPRSRPPGGAASDGSGRPNC